MTARPAHATVAEGGFTLVELLVAITLVALITTLLFGGLRFGTRAAAAVAVRVDRSAEIVGVYNFMQNELADARLLPPTNDPAQQTQSFDGEPDSISFVTIPPAYLALGGYHRLRMTTAGSGAARSVIVAWEQVPRGIWPEQALTLHPSLLLDKVASLEFAYFGVAEANHPPEWQDHWTDRTDLPQLIRLRITLADGWQAPDLIVAPRLADAQRPAL